MAPNKVANFASTNYYNQGSTPSQNPTNPALPISPLKNQTKSLPGQNSYPYHQYPGQGQNYNAYPGYQNSNPTGSHAYPGYGGQTPSTGHYGSGELGAQQSQQQIDMNRYNQQWSEYWQKYQNIQQQLQYQQAQQQQQSIN